MQVTSLVRVFKYDGQELPDPGASFSPAQVKDLYTSNYAELVNAEIEGPNMVDDKAVYTFKRTTGTKGFGNAALAPVQLPFVDRLALIAAGQPDPLQPRDRVAVTRQALELHVKLAYPLMDQRKQQAKRMATLPGLSSEALPLLL